MGWVRDDEQGLRICGYTSSIWRLRSRLGANSGMMFGSHMHSCSEVVEISCVRCYQLVILSATLGLRACDVLKDGGGTGSMSLGI